MKYLKGYKLFESEECLCDYMTSGSHSERCPLYKGKLDYNDCICDYMTSGNHSNICPLYKGEVDSYDSLKGRLSTHYHDNISEFGEEEVDNVIEILNQYDDNLTGLGKWDKIALLRLINDDSELYDELDNIHVPSNDANLFDSYIVNKKIFEYLDEERKFSLVFDDKYLHDVLRSLKRNNIKYQENSNIYYHMKKKTEVFAWAKSEQDIIKVVPVNNLQVLKAK